MSDQSPPPKPKPGSLRDRIAAFENKQSAPASAPPPPRPKPGGLQWKPRAPSPPSSPGSSADRAQTPEKKTSGAGSGMSASDAKESIGMGGTLKERMAALQGRGGFGAPAPVIPPKPTEKPKWKPPPVVQSPPTDEEDKEVTEDTREASRSPAPDAINSSEEDVKSSFDTQEDVTHEGPDVDADPEEEERQRRAAIAARIARLGGARVGMAPPAFGMRPATKKVETPKEEIEKEIDSTSLKSQGVDFSADQGPVVDADHLSREVPADVVRENSASHDNSISSSSLSVDQPSPSLQPARAMPVPTGPRRAAPPRKKAVKSPSPQEQAHTILDKEETSVSPAQISNVSEDPAHTPASIKDLLGGDVESEIGVVNKSVDDHYPLSDAALSVPPSVPAQQEEQKLVIPDEPLAHSEQTANQSHVTHDLDLAEEPTDVPEATYDTTAELVSEPVSAEAEEDEEDEVARRKRVADKLAQMGGFNLFTGPPPVPRRVSADSIPTEVDADTEAHEDAKDEPELEESSAPPVAPRRESIEIEEAHSSSPGLEGRTSTQEGIDTAQVSYQDADAGEPEFHEVGYDVEEEAQDDLRREVSDHEVEDQAEPLQVRKEGQATHRLRYEDDTHIERDTDELEGEQDTATDDYHHHDSYDGRESISGRNTTYLAQHIQEPYQENFNYEHTTMVDSAGDTEEERYQRHYTNSDDGEISAEDYKGDVDAEGDNGVPTFDDDDDDDDMDPSRLTRRVPLPPVNLNSRPGVISPGPGSARSPASPPVSPPPPRIVQRAIEVENEERVRAESPDIPPRPVPPPFSPTKNVHVQRTSTASEEEAPIPPPRRSMPPPPRRASVKIATAEPQAREAIASRASQVSPPPLARLPPPIAPSPLFRQAATDRLTYEDTEEAASGRSVPQSASDDAEPQTANETSEVDAEQARRQTIAERMARLGGIRFGAPMPPMARPPLPPPPPPVSARSEDSTIEPEESGQNVVDKEEEDELARKQRIAVKLAGMGGMRFGMLPQALGSGPKPVLVRQEESETEEASSQSPLPVPAPHRALPPARPPPVVRELDSEQESRGTSDDGVRVEAEDSEMEEVKVDFEDANDEGEQGVAPPPVPGREGRRASGVPRTDVLPTPPPRTMSRSPPVPSGRPPIPSIPAAIFNRRPSLQIRRPGSRKSSIDHVLESSPPAPPPRALSPPVGAYRSQSEYVMVEAPENMEVENAPLPPQRPPRGPPPRSALPPPPPPSAVEPDSAMMSSSQWVLPSIPSASLDLGLGSSNEFSEESSTDTPPPPPRSTRPVSRPSSQLPPAHPPSVQKAAIEAQLSSEDLMAVWGKVGVHICEAATMLHEKSKKSLIGDGSFMGFVMAVLHGVPNAMQPSGMDFGHIVYAQTSSAVQRRMSEILPGDIIALYDAKFKGHKGLQTYHQSVGVGEPLVGVINEFETKKSKVRVFQANQHVGQQTVESVSYRLEDMKSGHVKIFRVLES